MVQVSTNTEWLLQGFRYELESTVRPKTVEYYCGEVDPSCGGPKPQVCLLIFASLPNTISTLSSITSPSLVAATV